MAEYSERWRRLKEIDELLEYECIRCGKIHRYKNRRVCDLLCDSCFAPDNRWRWKEGAETEGNPPLLRFTPESIKLLDEKERLENPLCQTMETAKSSL